MKEHDIKLDLESAYELALHALAGAGASDAMAQSLAAATVRAEARGQSGVGFAHLVDYLESLRAGRIHGAAIPRRLDPAPALIAADADAGTAQLAFDGVFEDFVDKAHRFGVALFSLKNSYTTGELGDYVHRLAGAGLVGLAMTNGPALITVPGSKTPVYCTNPLAFAAPRANGPPLLIDQSSSATAFVNIREAAARGESIPDGWAIDADGHPTTDARAALNGALLAFGGTRGANIALMVEIMAAAGGGNWSLDAPDFKSGDRTPSAGLTVVAFSPSLLDPDFENRLAAQLDRLSGKHGIHIPGEIKAERAESAQTEGLRLPLALVSRISAFARKT